MYTSCGLNRGRDIDGWEAPGKGYVKVNVDGACNPNGGASACAGVMRDYKGKVRGDFLFNMGIGDCYVAERWAILMGLKWS